MVELVDTLSWGGSGESRAGSSPAIGKLKEPPNYIIILPFTHDKNNTIKLA